MQYVLLIYGNERSWNEMSEADKGQEFAEYMAFSKGLVETNQMRGGDALEPVNTAKSVRVRDGKMNVTDGPFAETKEQLGGYYLVEAKSIDEAVSIAAKIPGARTGVVEVRPVIVFPTP